MINLNDIQVFVCVAKVGTINAAAKKLGVPPSTVSRAVTRLEKELGFQLMRRTTHGIVLTDVGRDYLEQCEAAFDRLHEAHEALGQHRVNPRGTLRLAVTTAFASEVITPVVKQFLDQYPEIRLKIIFHGNKFASSLSDDLDFVFQIGQPADSSLRVKMFPPILQCLCASPGYVQAHGLPAEPSLLKKYFCIGYSSKESAIWHLNSKTERQSVTLPLRISVADPVIHKDLALNGLGIAKLPMWAALPEIAAGKLVVALPQWKVEPLYFHALYAERSAMTPKIKVFLEFLERFIATEYDPRNGSYHSSDIFQIS